MSIPPPAPPPPPPPAPEFQALLSLSDPTLTGEQLRAIAMQFPSLWPHVLAHPSIYPDLAEWINASTASAEAAIPNPAMPVIQTSFVGQQQPGIGTQTPGGKGKRWWISVVAVIGVIAIAAGAWFGLKSFNGTPDSTAAGPGITSVVPDEHTAFALLEGGSVYAWGATIGGNWVTAPERTG